MCDTDRGSVARRGAFRHGFERRKHGIVFILLIRPLSWLLSWVFLGDGEQGYAVFGVEPVGHSEVVLRPVLNIGPRREQRVPQLFRSGDVEDGTPLIKPLAMPLAGETDGGSGSPVGIDVAAVLPLSDELWVGKHCPNPLPRGVDSDVRSTDPHSAECTDVARGRAVRIHLTSPRALVLTLDRSAGTTSGLAPTSPFTRSAAPWDVRPCYGVPYAGLTWPQEIHPRNPHPPRAPDRATAGQALAPLHEVRLTSGRGGGGTETKGTAPSPLRSSSLMEDSAHPYCISNKSS